jgi:UDP-N-acetylglucosamine transferase subunit ALG13
VSVIFCLFLLRFARKKQAKNARHQAVFVTSNAGRGSLKKIEKNKK